MYLKMGKMNEKHVSKNAHKTLDGLKNHLKAKKLFHLLQKLENRK